MKVWVFTAKFPNIVQPWLANGVAQIVKNNGSVKIFSLEKGDVKYPRVIDEFNLNNDVEVIDTEGVKVLRQLFLNLIRIKHTPSLIRAIISFGTIKNKGTTFIKNFLNVISLAPFLFNRKPDLIHSHSEPAGYKLLPIVRASKAPLVITFHGLPPANVNQITEGMRREYTKLASLIFVNTYFAKQQFISIGAESEKIEVLPQGIDTSKFTYRPNKYPLDEPIKILTVGRYSPEKGQEYAIKAIANLLNLGYMLEYTLIGEGIDKERLLNLIDKLNVHQQIKIESALTSEAIINRFHQSHLFILPSLKPLDNSTWEETQGVTIQEAQACGAIVIATNTGGIPECVIDNSNAFLVEDRSSNAIAEKVEFIINHPDRWKEWQDNARKHVELHFDLNKIGKRQMDAFRRVINESKNRQNQHE